MTRAAFIVASVFISACAQAPATHVAEPPPVVSVTFRGLWFSETEVRRIGRGERNVQPTQDIELKTWEYTDPVGSAHPDVVNVVVRITNPSGAPPRTARVALREQWNIGGDGGEGTATWEDPLPERLSEPVRLASGQTLSASQAIAVAEQVKRLGGEDRYPWRLRVYVTIRDNASGQSLVSTQAELPIIPGD